MQFYGNYLYWMGALSNIVVFDISTKSIATFTIGQSAINTFTLFNPPNKNGIINIYIYIYIYIYIHILNIYCISKYKFT